MSKIKVIIADDHQLFREGLKRLLDQEDEIDCVAMASNGTEAVRMARTYNPDIVLLDISMPRLDGISAAKRIKLSCPTTAIIILSQYKLDEYIVASLGIGVSGYLLKDMHPKELIQSIFMAHKGEAIFDLRAVDSTFRRLAGSRGRTESSDTDLRTREIEVLKLIAKGLPNKTIAERLKISEHTVRSHTVNIYKKLAVGTRVEATLYALKKGWVISEEIVENGDL